MGAPKAWVLWKMGSPQSHEPWYYHPGDLAQVHCHSSLPCGCGPSLLCQKKCRTSQSCKCTSHWEATPIGEVLHYRDDWNDQGRWMDLGSAWADHFATWDVYLDKDDHFVGWRLVDPPGQDRTREQFATMDTSR